MRLYYFICVYMHACSLCLSVSLLITMHITAHGTQVMASYQNVRRVGWLDGEKKKLCKKHVHMHGLIWHIGPACTHYYNIQATYIPSLDFVIHKIHAAII